jgi:hypothetical protein
MDEDVFDSVTWETPASEPVRDPYDPNFQPSSTPASASTPVAPSGPGYRQSVDSVDDADASTPKWSGYLLVQVKDPIKELDGTKDVYISYHVEARVRASESFHVFVGLYFRRRTYPPSLRSTLLLVEGSRILFSSENILPETFRLVSYHPYLKSTVWVSIALHHHAIY